MYATGEINIAVVVIVVIVVVVVVVVIVVVFICYKECTNRHPCVNIGWCFVVS